jgi:DNA-binding transcriptional LysR family regulator
MAAEGSLMELRHLRYFVAVAEEENFTRAAERLGISQPPLSEQIRQLETELGTPLLRRRKRGVELTDAGRLLLHDARVILDATEQAKAGVQRIARGVSGRLIVGSAGATYFHPLVPAVIREYEARFPDIVLTTEEGGSSLLMSRLRAGHIDVAFICLPFGDRSGLTITPLADEEMVIALPAAHPLAGAASLPLAALAKEAFVLPRRDLNPEGIDVIMNAFRRAGLDPPVATEAPQITTMPPLVAAGLGVAIVPRSLSRAVGEGIRYVPIEGESPRVDICLAHRNNDHSPAVRNFVTIARRIARGNGNAPANNGKASRNHGKATANC